jgi:GMP synthase-like glutamine amidotransferase
MKPVAIFRFSPTEGPGYFATYLERRSIPWRLIEIDNGEAVPADARDFCGIGLMGGPMSVNDPLPWIEPMLGLIRRSVEAGVPVVGHCLGGQLMSRALGGVVTRNPVKEIGWGVVKIQAGDEARQWFGDLREFDAFHWHGETFSNPAGARALASSAYCGNQAFVLGPHLGMQMHVEMTPELIRSWCHDWHKEVASLAARMPSVQTPEEMQADLEGRIGALRAAADRLYQRWTAGLET